MEWIKITSSGRRKMHIGDFKVISNTSAFGLLEEHKGRTHNKYLHEKLKLVKFAFEKDGMFKSKTNVTINKQINERLDKETQLVAYYDKDAIYLAPYSLGQEYIEKFLRTSK